MKTKNRFITGYAGLRTLAVIGVILYHLDPNRFMGGYLGVPIFLVLTGYLVTDHMFHAYETKGIYDNKGFYLRRLKRLYPQMITLLWLCSSYILLFQRNLLPKLNQIVASNLLNVYNWWQIFNGQSYFERFAANESPFTHLWTMSIEGQFYIIWPLAIFLLVKYVRKKSTRFWILTILTILSALEMALLFKPGVDTSRIYYGSDTRFFSLGLGAMLAVVWPSWRLREDIDQQSTRLLDGIGAIALVGMLWLAMSPLSNPVKGFVYHGGMFLFTIFTTLLVAIVAHPGSHWNSWLTNSVFKWVGSRSYGIYLYQFPVMIFFEDKVKNIADHVVLYRVIEVIIILVLAELAYRYVEKPLGKITWAKTKAYFAKVISLQNTNLLQKATAVLATIIFIVGSAAMIKSNTAKAANPNNSPLAKQIKANRGQQLRDNKKLIKEAQHETGKNQTKNKVLAEAKARAKSHPVNKEFEKFDISQVDLQLAQDIRVTAIGDSVMAGSSQNLKQLMPHAIIDAAVSRQLESTIDLFQQYKNQGALNQNVLIGLGTNGPFSTQDLDRLMKIIGTKRKVFWINTYVPSKDWQGSVNAAIKAASKKYSNITVIDWYDLAAKHPNWFYGDGTHPNPTGSKYYSAYITKNIVEKGRY
ncbi:acyltransferase family protein [Lactobacillus sp. PV034]|uniref:acyltransferase family protein n=1 Tax=Lactobacillus sp. PV034 TaxID=2594495 RepID=UPI00224081AA|nr:acyltransferase family protein [Lactobacillus sp. PV034]QNQ80500.1 acetyltransferase [Lactobacillus sp. PV034]